MPQVRGLLFWQECKNVSGYTIYFSTYHEAEEYIIGLELSKLTKKLEKSDNDVVRCENIPVTPEEN